MRDRKKQRELKQKSKQEELNIQNSWGCKDLTPYNAVRTINGKEIKYK
jgi:hypothetical protein